MSYEIDYIPVGNGEKSGDAIALRFGNLSGARDGWVVVVIDGGFKESGQELVDHIKNCYGTDTVDLVINTHPDADHASGLSVVLEQLKVNNLLMHKPWDHAEDIKSLFKDGRITASGLEDRLEKSLQYASDLESLAKRKGVNIVEPFQGVSGYDNRMIVLGPSLDYYNSLLALFKSTPEPIKALGVLAPVQQFANKVSKTIQDFWHIDLLDDDNDSTSPENNTSAIVLFQLDGHKLLFTGDAGKTALHFAADYAESIGLSLENLNFFDIPHHGSKRNLNSKLLKRIKTNTAFISAPADSPKHPAKKITNALKKHGASVYVNRDKILYHHHDTPFRQNYSTASEEPFHDYVEE